jgi:hypothetical protein
VPNIQTQDNPCCFLKMLLQYSCSCSWFLETISSICNQRMFNAMVTKDSINMACQLLEKERYFKMYVNKMIWVHGVWRCTYSGHVTGVNHKNIAQSEVTVQLQMKTLNHNLYHMQWYFLSSHYTLLYFSNIQHTGTETPREFVWHLFRAFDNWCIEFQQWYSLLTWYTVKNI